MTKFFYDLNYSMANEDTHFEYQIVKKEQLKKILAIGGSGARALPFLALEIDSLDICDVSSSQILLIKLKHASIKALSFEEFKLFWCTPSVEQRNKLLNKIQLPSEVKLFYHHFNNISSDIPMLYWGKWEKTFRIFSKLLKALFKEETRVRLFESEDSYKYYEENIKGFRWNLVIAISGNKAIFNSLLYKGDFVKKNIDLSYYKFYSKAFERLFKLEIKKSHFLQLCFFGEVRYEEGLPLEFQEDIFDKIKNSQVKVSYHECALFEVNKKVDFISLSDIASYFDGELEKKYLQKLKALSPQVLVDRYYLRHPNVDSSGYADISSQFAEEAEKELVQMYDIKVWRFR